MWAVTSKDEALARGLVASRDRNPGGGDIYIYIYVYICIYIYIYIYIYFKHLGKHLL